MPTALLSVDAARIGVGSGLAASHAGHDMILLTDRPDEGGRLATRLALGSQWTVVGLDNALTVCGPVPVVICDVALDTTAIAGLVHAALTHLCPSSERRVLFLARDPSQLTMSQARMLGASVILPCRALPAEIRTALQKLLGPAASGKASSSTPAPGGVRLGVSEAGAALGVIFESARRSLPIPPATLERGGDAVVTAIRQSDIQSWLDVVWNVDHVTYQHCLLVAGLVAAFSSRLGLSMPHQRLLTQAALIHDIGKAMIPTAILNKPGLLCREEMTVMRTHAVIGHGLLAKQRTFDDQILDIVRHHHEYLDGSGYPDGLTGPRISQFVRITTITDIFAALIERRPYKAPHSRETAFAILGDMTGKLDLGLLESFRQST